MSSGLCAMFLIHPPMIEEEKWSSGSNQELGATKAKVASGARLAVDPPVMAYMDQYLRFWIDCRDSRDVRSPLGGRLEQASSQRESAAPSQRNLRNDLRSPRDKAESFSLDSNSFEWPERGVDA
eukprot:16452390-Heterocapsa_arctica.AAC.3